MIPEKQVGNSSPFQICSPGLPRLAATVATCPALAVAVAFSPAASTGSCLSTSTSPAARRARRPSSSASWSRLGASVPAAWHARGNRTAPRFRAGRGWHRSRPTARPDRAVRTTAAPTPRSAQHRYFLGRGLTLKIPRQNRWIIKPLGMANIYF